MMDVLQPGHSNTLSPAQQYIVRILLVLDYASLNRCFESVQDLGIWHLPVRFDVFLMQLC